MIKKLLLTTVFVLTALNVSAQKKSELVAEINNLKSQLDSITTQVSEIKRSERISVANAETYKAQVKELQDANAVLLKNLNNFAELSTKNSDNVNRTLEQLRKKEKQLKWIKDTFSSNDSIALVVLTNAKQTLGENAKIGVSNGNVIISADQKMFFGEDASAVTIDTTAVPWLGKIATILAANPDTAITIEGLSITGELNIAAQQANAIANVFQKQFAIDPERIHSIGKDGNFKEGINLKMHPKYEQFYTTVKEQMKN